MHSLGRSDRYREVRLAKLEVSNDGPRLKEHSLGSQGTMKLEAKLRRREWRTGKFQKPSTLERWQGYLQPLLTVFCSLEHTD